MDIPQLQGKPPVTVVPIHGQPRNQTHHLPKNHMNGYYQLKQSDNGKFHFNLYSGNHQVILTSQMYADRSGAINGIKSVQTNGTSDANFERKQSTNDEPYFALKAANGQAIGRSQMYSSEAARDNGIKSVQTNAPSEDIREEK